VYQPKPKKVKDNFFILEYPWIFDANAKTRLLRIEAQLA
jgi:hypothetical protein